MSERRTNVLSMEPGDKPPSTTRGKQSLHVLVIDFSLEGIGEEGYRGLVEPVAPVFADLPGLLSKTWLANEETSTYGGVYV